MQNETATPRKYALIGAGPMGLAMAKTLTEQGIPFQGFELHSDVGGLWDIDAPRSTMYESAHLISSKKMTEFADFPFDPDIAEYPSHREMKTYFHDFARHFDLYQHYRFNTEVLKVTPVGQPGDGWSVSSKGPDGKEKVEQYAGILIANGTLSEPNMPKFKGTFTGELIHACDYRKPEQFAGKNVRWTLFTTGLAVICPCGVDIILCRNTCSVFRPIPLAAKFVCRCG